MRTQTSDVADAALRLPTMVSRKNLSLVKAEDHSNDVTCMHSKEPSFSDPFDICQSSRL